MIPVTAFAENYVLPFTTPISFAPINGTFNIGARYCEPEAQVPEYVACPSRDSTIMSWD